jgi:hypothetical protein
LSEDLLDVIDSAAARLLAMAGFGATTGAELTKATLPEQVKAFEAVVAWAKTRKELRPPERVKAKFDGIRSQFNGSPNKRRRSPAAPEAEPDPPDSADSGAVAESIDNGAADARSGDLFDA